MKYYTLIHNYGESYGSVITTIIGIFNEDVTRKFLSLHGEVKEFSGDLIEVELPVRVHSNDTAWIEALPFEVDDTEKASVLLKEAMGGN